MECDKYRENLRKLIGSKSEWTAENYLDHVRFLRDCFSDIIPDEILHSTTDRVGHKVRRSWLQVVIEYSCNMIFYGYASERSAGLFYEFLDYRESPDFLKNSKKIIDEKTVVHILTDREEIVRANKLLTSLINDLKNYTASSGSSSF